MKSNKEGSLFCNELTFYVHCKTERIVELNHVRDCVINVLSESDFKHQDNRIRIMGNLDDISLNVIDGDVKNIELKISNLRVDTLKMLCLEKFFAREGKYKDMNVETIEGKKPSDY